MADNVYDNVSKMWFGTKEKMGWIETPDTGADVSPQGYSAEATLLDGGGFARNSWDSHKRFQFAWPDSSSRALASLMHGYANGSYGRGLIYFQDPMYYDTNVLARRIADPSMAIDYEAPSWLASIVPTGVPTGSNPNNLPVVTASYTLPAGYVHDPADGVWVPIPEGQELWLGAIYNSTNPNAGIVVDDGTTKSLLAPLGVNTTAIVSQSFSGIQGVTVYPGFLGSNASAATISITAVTARIRAASGQLASYQNLFTNPNSATTGAAVQVRRNLAANPNVNTLTYFTVNHGTGASGSLVRMTDDPAFPAYARSIWNVGSTAIDRGMQYTANASTVLAVGRATASAWVRVSSPQRIQLLVNGPTTNNVQNDPVDIPADTWTRLTWRGIVSVAAATELRFYAVSGGFGRNWAAGDTLDVTSILVENSSLVGEPFSGDTPNTSEFTYSWVGTVGNSQSTATALSVVGSSPTGNTVTSWRSTELPYSGSGFTRYRLDSVGNSLGLNLTDGATGTPGQAYTMILVVRAASRDQTVTFRFRGTALQVVELTKGEWTVLRSTFVAGSGATSQTGLLVTGSTSGHQIGDFVDIDLHTLVPVPSVDQPFTAPGFSGATQSGDGVVFSWDGTPEASTSTMLSTGAIANGPWYSGEGHSGCRFVGKPTLFNYTGVGGGQVGLAATLKEVGSWS